MCDTVEVALEICDPRAKVPAYARPGDAGMDIAAIEDIKIKPGQTVIAVSYTHLIAVYLEVKD